MNRNDHTAQAKCAIAIVNIPTSKDITTTRLSNDVIQKSNELVAERQLQYLTGRILLAELLFQSMGISQLPEMIMSKNGRPSFRCPDLPDFNISHSGNTIMVALAQNCQVGIDLELKRSRKRLLNLAKHSFSETEYLWLSQLPEIEQEHKFWQLWTIRESILKLAGKGVWQMKEIAITPESQQLFAQFSPNLSCWSQPQAPLFWAMTTNTIITENNISLWQASSDLTALIPQPLPRLTQFNSN